MDATGGCTRRNAVKDSVQFGCPLSRTEPIPRPVRSCAYRAFFQRTQGQRGLRPIKCFSARMDEAKLGQYRLAVEELLEAVKCLSQDGHWDILYERVRRAQLRCEELRAALFGADT